MKDTSRGFVTCWPVITEAAWMLRHQPGGPEQVLEVMRMGTLQLLPLDRQDTGPIRTIMSKYRDLPAQLADAALLHLAERGGIDTIFTLDRRDFGVYRLADGRTMKVIPAAAN